MNISFLVSWPDMFFVLLAVVGLIIGYRLGKHTGLNQGHQEAEIHQLHVRVRQLEAANSKD